MKLSSMVLYYNGENHIDACLRSLAAQDVQPDELLVVDNGSSIPLRTRREWQNMRVLRSDTNQGVASGFNLGIGATSGDIIIIVTQDVVLQPGCLSELVHALNRRPNAAIAGCKFLFPQSDVLQHSGASLSYPLALPCQRGKHLQDLNQFAEEDEVPYVSGAILGIRRSMLETIGGFDEQFFPAYYEDSDLCFRARDLGFDVIYVPTAVAWHAENSSIDRMSYDHFLAHHTNRLRFICKRLPYVNWVRDFYPAESAFLVTLNRAEERHPLADAYIAISHEHIGEQYRAMLRQLATVANGPCELDGKEPINTALETDEWWSADPWRNE